MNRRPVASIAVAFGFWACCLDTPARESLLPVPLPPATQRSLADIDRRGGAEAVPGGHRTAMELNRKADTAYRKGDYDRARRLYGNSYPFDQNAYARVMAADAHLRAIVQGELWHPVKGDACAWDSAHFARAIDLDVEGEYLVGLMLAERRNDRRIMRTGVYEQAAASAVCLRATAREFEALPPRTCIDVRRIERCLGPPLLR
jgi:hypothetical protein